MDAVANLARHYQCQPKAHVVSINPGTDNGCLVQYEALSSPFCLCEMAKREGHMARTQAQSPAAYVTIARGMGLRFTYAVLRDFVDSVEVRLSAQAALDEEFPEETREFCRDIAMERSNERRR